MSTPTGNFPLATETSNSVFSWDVVDGSAAGASGSSSGGIHISRGALIAIIVIVIVVASFGIATSILFYIAKRREWTVKETLRRSAKKVVDALTPRRTEFPKSVKESMGRGDVPPTPRIKPEYFDEDVEKGIEKEGDKKKQTNVGRK
ncbi:uncharacterized protein CTHT_0044050 [Thermochaetoides thermophila DSM 1495]|uniref:Uncharacterized protein n=1 Tax=Chaetomium thermophilum (strain DSM 1495 / CBS 144.50 / IMI 039719) TaxID=759272 RepID=G0S901_CHATD|nr:hypothetical protein CTHT_0044050 [Thermochaetoides thermophila DSM 1495]EGS19912.1 hypothetical protein CTHT_0044050 [Thermochaetoides thermophila DSM 1495]